MATRAIWATDKRPLARYTRVAIFLHWAIAAMILFNLASGFFTGIFPRGTMAVHISSGITILALSVVRVVWRLTHRPPPLRSDLRHWEKGSAHVVHFLLYAAMILMPLSGWAMISANPPPGSVGAAAAQVSSDANGPAAAAPRRRGPPMLWWTVPLPRIAPIEEMGRTAAGLPAQKEKHEQLETVHALGGYLLVALFLLHVAGALKHQFIDRHRELARMGIGEPERVG